MIEEQGLIKSYMSLDHQITENGFDLTVESIHQFNGSGKVDFSNSERELPETEEIEPVKDNEDDRYGWWHVSPGIYKIKTNETFTLPLDLAAFAQTRSTLLRSGAYTQTAFWESGFEGKAEFVLIVHNPEGISIKQNARVTQVAFVKTTGAETGYAGVYKNIE